ncbi:putative conjugative pilus assembly protein [Orientia tsutsugamushi str. Gilliam]|uniref:Conjugal transfer protein n=1 Tax=Orientia tsutsugamushi str. Gilliam TaxID=1359184 RepID=A0A0F3MCZ7_ORITS|nr:conjugal transfer protein TraB [Orientia tsutsugamushi]KJV53600.1 putative conjugative pilus assembly protein [Orientia tsutsugamushi str. Gilliam]SPR07892.1 conjugal transfer protein [Orientia tsutsugamushi str. Gilliam]
MVDKSSKVVRMAALNGVFSSIAKFLQAKAIKPDMTTAPTLNIMTQCQVNQS